MGRIVSFYVNLKNVNYRSCKVKIGQRHCVVVTICVRFQLATVKLSEQVYNFSIQSKVKFVYLLQHH